MKLVLCFAPTYVAKQQSVASLGKIEVINFFGQKRE
jgi:hypothetical protein